MNLGKKILGVILALGLASPVFANANQTQSSIEPNPIAAAAVDALTVDFPVAVVLAAASAAGIISGVPAILIPPFVAGAFGGQLVRYVCKNHYSEGEPSVMCGALAGAVKYGLRSSLLGMPPGIPLLMNMIRGAVDIGNYEWGRKELIEAARAGERSRVAGMIFTNEIFNEMFKAGFYFMTGTPYYDNTQPDKTLSNIAKTALLVPAAISTSIYTTNAWFGDSIKKFLSPAPEKK
jgi:hypothetical protein